MTAQENSVPLAFQSGQPGPKWTNELADFIREQYLTYRKSAGEIALMLGPAFTRNAVTGKLYRMGALQARSGLSLGKAHGLPKANNFCPGRKKKAAPAKKATPPGRCAKAVPATPPGAVLPADHLEGSAFVQRTERLFDIQGIPLLEAKKGQCRWPARTEGDVAHICGGTSSVGAYCAHHAAIAYRLKPISRVRLLEMQATALPQ